MPNKEEYQKPLLYITVVLILVLVFLVIKPVLNSLLSSIILAYLFYPLYKLLLKRIKNRSVSSLITIFIIILILFVPFGFVLNSVIKESSILFQYSRNFGSKELLKECEDSKELKCELAKLSERFSEETLPGRYLKDFLAQISRKFFELASNFLTSMPSKLLQLFVVFFSTFILLKDGEDIFNQAKSIIPLSDEHRNKFIRRFKEVSYGVVYGTIIIAIVQALLAILGFWIFSVRAPIFWGILVFIISILPFVAPPVVYVPLALFKILNGIITSSSSDIFNGVMLIIWGTVVISLVDNLLRYKITGRIGKVHPLIVLIGIVGGIQVFGIIGLFFGPLVLVFALTFLEIYVKK